MAKIDEVHEMLKVLLDDLEVFRQEALESFEMINKRFDKLDNKLCNKIDGLETKLTEKLDVLIKQLDDHIIKRASRSKHSKSYQNFRIN